MTQGGDFGDALSKLLDNPEALKGLMSLAGSLMNAPSSPTDSAQSQVPSAANQAPKEPEPSVQASAVPIAAPSPSGGDALSQLLALSSKSSKNDPRCTLLRALKPYMNPTRRERIDSLIKALELTSLASGFLGGKLF